VGRTPQDKTTVNANSRDNTTSESRRVDVKLEDATQLAYGTLHNSDSNLLKVSVGGAGKIADIVVQ
jgi:hypothetical protein